ncbi:MAG: hypothetical protein ACRBCJ_14395 [Hyphomicrobiaceae bacterium]
MNEIKKLRTLWLAAVAVGGIFFLAGLWWANSSEGPGLDWIWGIAIFGAAAVAYNVAFFVLCSAFFPKFATLVKDDTEVQGDDVAHVVRYASTGDDVMDAYIRTYATARATSAVAIVSVIVATVALTFF